MYNRMQGEHEATPCEKIGRKCGTKDLFTQGFAFGKMESENLSSILSIIQSRLVLSSETLYDTYYCVQLDKL